MLEKSIRIEYN